MTDLIDGLTKDELKELITKNLSLASQAKKEHKASNQCTSNIMQGAQGGCTACHFWSGIISALNELLGNPGIID